MQIQKSARDGSVNVFLCVFRLAQRQSFRLWLNNCPSCLRVCTTRFFKQCPRIFSPQGSGSKKPISVENQESVETKVSTHKAAYSQNMQKNSRSFKPSRNQQKRAHHVKSGPILSCSKRTKKHDFLADLKELKRWIKGTFNRPFSRRQSERL